MNSYNLSILCVTTLFQNIVWLYLGDHEHHISHWGLVLPCDIGGISQQWFRYLDGTKPLSEPLLISSQLGPWEHTQWHWNQNATNFIHANAFKNTIWKKVSILFRPQCVNSLRPRQNGRHFPDDIFKWIFLNENVWISIKISSKFVPKDPINNIPALVEIMAWRRLGDKPLSEAMMVR